MLITIASCFAIVTLVMSVLSESLSKKTGHLRQVSGSSV